MTANPRPARRLRHRLPVRLRHHWKLVALCAGFFLLSWGVFGSGAIHPYVTSTRSADSSIVVQNLTGTEDLFDHGTAHELEISFREAAYEDMLTEYFKSGEKEYVEADLTIDGTFIPSVGIRLKGNSTLMGFTWKGESRTRGGSGGRMPEGFEPPEGMELPEDGRMPEGFQPPGGEQGEGGFPGGRQGEGDGFGGFGMALKAEEPEKLPWLISFDEFVEGRRYQGRTQLAVRPEAAQSKTLVNEALGISVVGAAGEPTQRYSYGSFTVNGRSSSSPRLLVEYLDEGYAESLGDGVLYKSLASGSFTYKGEDQTEYTEDFKQINKVGSQDLKPVIDLVRWVEESSDEEFAEGLAGRLDVTSFARYLALQNLIVNFDDMAGPGRNYYLWYDLGSRKFKVITWDLNYAFSGDPETSPEETVAMGGGMTAPGGGQAQQGGPPQGQQQPSQGFPGGREGGMGMMGHALKDRFLETPAFKEVYTEQYRDLYRTLVSTGALTGLLDSVVGSYRLNKGDTTQIASEAETLRTTLNTRAQTLRSNAMISG